MRLNYCKFESNFLIDKDADFSIKPVDFALLLYLKVTTSEELISVGMLPLGAHTLVLSFFMFATSTLGVRPMGLFESYEPLEDFPYGSYAKYSATEVWNYELR